MLNLKHPILKTLESDFFFFLQAAPFAVLVTLSDSIYLILRRYLVYGQMQTNLFFGYDSQVTPEHGM